MKKLCVFAASLIFCASAFAAYYPEPVGYFFDNTGSVSASTGIAISNEATRLSNGSGPEVAVCIIDSIGNESIESYSMQLAQKWKVGKKGQNNGVILIVAKQQRKIRIEVGYGLESVLPDSKAGQIISNVISPRLKAGDWDAGVRGGFTEIVKAIGGSK